MNIVDLNLSNLSETFRIFSENFSNLFSQIISSFKLYLTILTESVASPIEFIDIQITLLKVFLIIFLINLLLIAIYWKEYGAVITDRFIRPSTLKEIEELKLSVAKLKLPKEHTPRI